MSYDKKEFIYILYFVTILMKIQNIHLFSLELSSKRISVQHRKGLRSLWIKAITEMLSRGDLSF